MVDSVLLIDDNELDLVISTRTLTKCLEKEIKFVTALNGVEALELLYSFNDLARFNQINYPKLILLDINMPIMNGFEFLESFHENIVNGRIDPTNIIMLTSSEDKGDKFRSKRFKWVKGFITKPLSKQHIKNIIRPFVA